MAAGGFFSSGPVEEYILDCYRLAQKFSVDPDVFLNKPISEVAKHMKWTSILMERQRPPEEDA
jgi:hypothetical protein